MTIPDLDDISMSYQPPIFFLEYKDICLSCQNRFLCLVGNDSKCLGFAPVNDCKFKMVFSEEQKRLGPGGAKPLSRINKAVLTIGVRQFEIEGWRLDAGLQIVKVKSMGRPCDR